MRSYGIALLSAMVAALLASAAARPRAPRPRARATSIFATTRTGACSRGTEGAAGQRLLRPDQVHPPERVRLRSGSPSAPSCASGSRSGTNFDFGAPPGEGHDDTFLLSRLLFHADLHLTPWLRDLRAGQERLRHRPRPPGRQPQERRRPARPPERLPRPDARRSRRRPASCCAAAARRCPSARSAW